MTLKKRKNVTKGGIKMSHLLTISIREEHTNLFERLKEEPNKSKLILDLLKAHYDRQAPLKPKTASDLTSDAEAQEIILQTINAQRASALREEQEAAQKNKAYLKDAERITKAREHTKKRATISGIEIMLLSPDQRNEAKKENSDAWRAFHQFVEDKAQTMSEEAFKSYCDEYRQAYIGYCRKQQGD